MHGFGEQVPGAPARARSDVNGRFFSNENANGHARGAPASASTTKQPSGDFGTRGAIDLTKDDSDLEDAVPEGGLDDGTYAGADRSLELEDDKQVETGNEQA